MMDNRKVSVVPDPPLPEKPPCCGACHRCGAATRPERLCAACSREITTEAKTDA